MPPCGMMWTLAPEIRKICSWNLFELNTRRTKTAAAHLHRELVNVPNAIYSNIIRKTSQQIRHSRARARPDVASGCMRTLRLFVHCNHVLLQVLWNFHAEFA